MMPRVFAACMFAGCAAMAQTPAAPTAAPNASVSGVVKDAGTGQPLANYTVSTNVNATWVNNTIVMSPTTKEVKSITGEQGSYKLSDLPPGQYRIQARSTQHFGPQLMKNVTVAGHDVDGIDFHLVVDGAITGRVFDENKEPVPGMTVFLISREYYLGTLSYFFKSAVRTNDRGEYTLTPVPAGHPYLIMVEKRDPKLPAHSEVPLNPKLRRRVPIRTWYPNSPSKEGGQVLVLRSGERREGVDLEVRKSPSYCIEGTLVTPRGPAALSFFIEAQQPSSGISSGGGMFVMSPGGITASDGKFRICDLYPGSYRLTVTEMASSPNQQPSNYAAATVTVSDHDLRDLRIDTSPGLPLEGEVVWDGPPPDAPVSNKVSISLRPLLRAHLTGENTSTRCEIPGTFSFTGLLLDDYVVNAFLNAAGLYIKDVTYAGRSVLYESLRPGSALGSGGLRVIVARDGATLGARVTDKDGNAVPDMHVLIMPAGISSEGMLAATLISGETDQSGQYTSHTLPPGKYYVAASEDSFDATPESINKLWRSRNRFKEVELGPNGTAQVTLEPVKIE